MDPSLFTLILQEDIPGNFIARGKGWGAFLDINPRRAGHTLVVPEQQAPRLCDLDEHSMNSLWSGVMEAQRLLAGYFQTSDFSIVVHDGPLAGQEIPHVHVHVIPRTLGDGGRSILSMWPAAPQPGSKAPDFTSLAEIASAIKQSG